MIVRAGAIFQTGDLAEVGEEAEEKTQLDFAGNDLGDGREARLIFGVKAIQLRAIDVEHADQMRIVGQERQHDFRS